MPFRKSWLILLLAATPVFCRAAGNDVPRPVPEKGSLPVRENRTWISTTHDSEFAPVPHNTARICQATHVPEELATPNPLMDKAGTTSRITVSFIVGTDGRVHSPLILESAGPSQDRAVLNAVRSWRYRPAMCNGVAAEAEAKIEFSGRQ